MELREERRCSGGNENHDGGGALDGPTKLVCFKDKGGAEEDKCKEEGCPLSLVRLVLLSMANDGYFGNKDNNVSHHRAMLSTPSRPPPLSPPLLPNSPSRGFVDVVVDDPKGCHDKLQWHGGDIFCCLPFPAAPRPPPSISMTTEGMSLPPPM